MNDTLREQINTLEALSGVDAAIVDMCSAEFRRGERVKVAIADENDKPISFVTWLTPEMVTVGLLAMRKHLEAQAASFKVAAVEVKETQ